MVIIRFSDSELEKQALDYLIGRFPFKTWVNEDLMLPENALGHLAAQGITFQVKGPATYEHTAFRLLGLETFSGFASIIC